MAKPESTEDDRTVPTADTTCWTVVRGAAAGRREDREAFARRYLPVVTAYLRARWGGTPLIGEIDDAVQQVFYDCFRSDGALARVDSTRPGGFRAFLFGVVRNVALRREDARRRNREVQPSSGFEDRLKARDESLATVFDRAWALSLMDQAVARHRESARNGSDAARRRVELLRLRFEEGLPIREIARRFELDPARVHKDYAKAREEFRDVLLDVVAFHHPGDRTEVERECADLIALVRGS